MYKNPLNLPVIPQHLIPFKKEAVQEAIDSTTLLNNGVLEALAKCLSSCILGEIYVPLISYANDIWNLGRTMQRIEQNWSYSSQFVVPFTSFLNLDGSLIKPADHIAYLGLPTGSSIGHTRRLLISHVERKISISYAGFVKKHTTNQPPPSSIRM